MILAGGIAAEIVNYPEEGPSDGASSDLSRLREIGIHLISQGMFGGHLAAVDISQLRPGDYPPEYMTALNDLVEGVISFSINLLTSVPKEITEGFVSGAMALTTEPAGPRAVDFRKAHIPDQFCADLRSKGKELLVRSKEFVQGKPVLAERVKETEVSSLS